LSLDAEQPQAPPRGDAGRRGLAAITLAAAVTLPTAPAATAQTLSETGSSLRAPLFALWGPAYHSRFSQVILRTTSSSSGTGIDSAAAGQITSWDDRAIAAANPGVKLPGTGIVLVHRGDDSSVVTLSGTQIAEIKG
jgi:ABC-type phosphate transport system substrate-binding protein